MTLNVAKRHLKRNIELFVSLSFISSSEATRTQIVLTVSHYAKNVAFWNQTNSINFNISTLKYILTSSSSQFFQNVFEKRVVLKAIFIEGGRATAPASNRQLLRLKDNQHSLLRTIQLEASNINMFRRTWVWGKNYLALIFTLQQKQCLVLTCPTKYTVLCIIIIDN